MWIGPRRAWLFLWVCGLPCCGSFDIPPKPTPDELSRGLVVLYPGGSSIPAELILWDLGIRAAGIDSAIDIIAWGTPGDSPHNATDFQAVQASALREAARLKQYMDDYPGSPVTLVGYSAGAAMAVLSAADLPADHPVDRVILMSADLSPGYDLTPMLDHTREGAMYYWSPFDAELSAATAGGGTVDRVFGPSAGSVGFESQDARLIAVPWSPNMIQYGNFGEHLDYLFNPGFIRDFLAPWIVTGRNP